MRLDKFLKVSRILKRRTVAKEASDSGRVLVNGKPAKPAKVLAVGDVCEITFGDKVIRFKVLNLRPFVKKEEADTMYEILD